MQSRRDLRPIFFLLSVVTVLLDRATKMWVEAHIELGSVITLIPGVFRLSHVLNTGAAFSMFAESGSQDKVHLGLIAFSVFATLVVAVMLWRVGSTFSLTSLGLALILGGAVGNLYDRLMFHHVVDFLEVHIGTYHWPDFNLADSAICIGAGLLLIEIFRPQPQTEEKTEETV